MRRSTRVLSMCTVVFGGLVAGCGVNEDSPTGVIAVSGGDGSGGRQTANYQISVAAGSNQVAPPNAPLTDSLSVRVTNAGQPVSGATVTWSVTSGNGFLSAATTFTNASGIAKVSYAVGNLPGRNTIRATLANGQFVDFVATAQ